MTRFKIDQETFGLSSLLEKMTRARVMDCFKDQDSVFFVVEQGQIGRVLGKGGEHVRKLREKLGMKVRVIEHNPEVTQFIRNAIAPLKVEQVEHQDGVVTITDSNKKTKSLLIGRNGKNLQTLNRAVKRFFNVEIKIQ